MNGKNSRANSNDARNLKECSIRDGKEESAHHRGGGGD